MSGIRAVVFDFGSTLFGHEPLARTVQRAVVACGGGEDVDAAGSVAAAIERAAQAPAELALGRDLSADIWRLRWRELYAAADALAPGAGDEVFALMHDPRQWSPFRDTAHVLWALHARGIRVGVISNTGWDVRTVFARWRLLDVVDSFALSYETGEVKPSTAAFDKVFAALGVAPRNVLMVGDDPAADSGAVRAGARTLLLPPCEPGGDNGLSAVLSLIDAR